MLQSCATIITGTSDTVAFDSEPKGATVYAVSKKGKIEVGTTPTISSISKKTTSIEFRKDGYYTEDKPVVSSFNLWYLGNLLLGGIPGMTVDLITGSHVNLPDKIETELKKKTE